MSAGVPTVSHRPPGGHPTVCLEAGCETNKSTVGEQLKTNLPGFLNAYRLLLKAMKASKATAKWPQLDPHPNLPVIQLTPTSLPSSQTA